MEARKDSHSTIRSIDDTLATNVLLEFIMPERQGAYVAFKAEQFGNKFFSYIIAAGLTVGLVLFWFTNIHNVPEYYVILLACFNFVFVVLIAWILAFLKKQFPSNKHYEHRVMFIILENLFLASFSLTVNFVLLARVLNGQCTNLAFPYIWLCNPSARVRGMPTDTTLCAFFLPLLCSMTLPFISNKVVVACYIITFAFAFSLDGYAKATTAISIYVLQALVAISIHFVQNYIQVLLFTYFFKTQALQYQREEDAKQQAEEMRNIIGKVAHDLKTPLSSFSYGLDSLRDAMERALTSQPIIDNRSNFGSSKDTDPLFPARVSPSKPFETANSMLQESKAALEAMQASHLQVMMILNRCIDYNTLSHGSSLVPRNSPVSVRHLLDVVLTWASKVYEHKQVIVEKCDIGDNDNINTDASWLQENLLCLVSNALKYSGQDIVRMRVTKIASKELNTFIKSPGSSEVKRSPSRMSIRNEPRLVIESCKSRSTDRRGSNVVNVREGGQSGHPSLSYPAQSEQPQELDVEQGLNIVIEEEGKVSDDSIRDESEKRQADLVRHFDRALQSRKSTKLEMIRFEVEDMGKAIDQDIADLLFVPPDSRAERSVGGSGLGLCCLAERVKALDGDFGVVTPAHQITYESEVQNYGNVFWFALPYVPTSTSSSYNKEGMESLLSSSGMNNRSRSSPMKSEIKDCDQSHCSILSSLAELSGRGSHLKPDSDSAQLAAEPQPISAVSPRNMPLKILVVDDSPLILKMLKSTLQKRGHVVTCTTNGYEALDLIRKGWREEAEKTAKDTIEDEKENRDEGVESVSGNMTSRQKEKGSYDAVLLDIQMPIIDGLQVMQEYSKMLLEYNVEQGVAKANEIVERKTDETKEMERDSFQEGICSLHDYNPSLRGPSAAASSPPPLAMVAMSANSDPKTMEAATAVGADYFFGKPFDIDAFLKVARRALSKKTETVH